MGPDGGDEAGAPHTGAPIRRAGAAATAVGALLLATAAGLSARGVEPVGVWFYQLAWAGTLAVLGGGLAWRTGRWPLSGAAAASLFFWSAPLWYFFELLNLRLENWYYVWLPGDRWVGWAGAFLAFTTVLPALHLAYRWAGELGLAQSWRRPRFRVRGRHLALTAGLGVAFVGLSMWRPRAFYPLVWGAVTLLLEPWNYRRNPGGSLLGDLARGRYARIVRLLAGGLFIGLLWEAYNSFALARWIYTVPGLEGMKLFEMPLPGFLGFPVLALDGYVAYRALEGAGVAVPAWGQGDPASGAASRDGATAGGDRDHGERGSRSTSFRPVRAAVAGAVALAFCAAVQVGVDRWTVDSFRPEPEELPGVGAATARALRTAGVEGVQELADRDSVALAAAAGLEAAEAGAAVRAARLARLRGMGARNAGALWEAGVRSVCQLARTSEAEAVAAVRRVRDTPRAGAPARVRVWLRAAREACPDARGEDAEAGSSSGGARSGWSAAGARDRREAGRGRRIETGRAT